MKAADVGRFALIIGLGFLAFITFIFAGTIIGSMWLEVSSCNCIHLPVGLYVLAIIAILFIVSLIVELVDYWYFIICVLERNREATIIAVIFIVAIILILILPGKSYYPHSY
jgi:hypothetical protein